MAVDNPAPRVIFETAVRQLVSGMARGATLSAKECAAVVTALNAVKWPVNPVEGPLPAAGVPRQPEAAWPKFLKLHGQKGELRIVRAKEIRSVRPIDKNPPLAGDVDLPCHPDNPLKSSVEMRGDCWWMVCESVEEILAMLGVSSHG